MNVALRLEKPSDYFEVEYLTREAFWNVHSPSCNEHYLVHVIRKSSSFIPELDIVALADGKIVGNIIYTRANIIGDDEIKHEVLCFGPISVLPAYQGQGIGSMLITHTIKLARNMGYRAILIYGDPDYYGRFGFAEAKRYGIRTLDNMYAVPLRAYELYENALFGISGRFAENEDYDINEKSAIEFDKKFPPKEKLSDTPSQKRFAELVKMREKP